MRATLTFGAFAQRAFALALFLLGLIAAIYGWRYGLGQLNDIGPGAFPMGLGVTLMALSAIAFLSSKRGPADEPRHLKAMLLVPLFASSFYAPIAILARGRSPAVQASTSAIEAPTTTGGAAARGGGWLTTKPASHT